MARCNVNKNDDGQVVESQFAIAIANSISRDAETACSIVLVMVTAAGGGVRAREGRTEGREKHRNINKGPMHSIGGLVFLLTSTRKTREYHKQEHHVSNQQSIRGNVINRTCIFTRPLHSPC